MSKVADLVKFNVSISPGVSVGVGVGVNEDQRVLSSTYQKQIQSVNTVNAVNVVNASALKDQVLNT